MLYLILFLFSLFLTYLVKNYAIKKSLVDIPNDRSSHTTPTPHGGGIAIALTWFIGISYLHYMQEMDSTLYYSLIVGVLISAVSYADDLFELSAKIRLIIQALVAILGIYFLGGFESFNLYFFSIENQLFTNIFAFFMIVWFINLYNFLDGINGYAGGEAVFLGLGGYLLFGGGHFLVLVVAVLGFLVWNWNKAKIFMGDVGSTLLGYNVAIFTIYYANQNASDFWIWIILFSVFWVDATYTLIKRALNKEKLSQAHKKHAYQRLTQIGWSHAKVSSWMLVINFILFCIVYFIANIFLAFIMVIILFFAIMYKIKSVECK